MKSRTGNVSRLLTLLIAAVLSVAAFAGDAPTAKRIALSFDDAPKGDGPVFTGDERAVKLLAALDSVDVDQVVFFVTTSKFARPGGRERVASYAAGGHLIANHSHSHLWANRTPGTPC